MNKEKQTNVQKRETNMYKKGKWGGNKPWKKKLRKRTHKQI